MLIINGIKTETVQGNLIVTGEIQTDGVIITSTDTNTKYGYEALDNISTGIENTAVGYQALNANTTGQSNVAVGRRPLYTNLSGSSNIAIGRNALANSTSANNCVAIGFNSLNSTTASGNSAYGRNSGNSIFTGTNNLLLGLEAGFHASQKSDVTNSTALGYQAFTENDNEIVLGNTSVNQILYGDRASGNITKLKEGPEMVGTHTRWEDLRVDATRIRQGATAKPDFNTTRNTLDFPDGDATEIAYLNIQMPHNWKQGSTVYPHIHWLQQASQAVDWTLEYAWIEIGDTTTDPPTFTSYTINTLSQSYTSGNIHQISTNATGISGSGKTLSSMLICRLYRAVTDLYSGDAGLWEFDIHYEIDSLGSQTETAKTDPTT